MGNKFSILEGKELNLDCIEGRFAAFAKLPYAVTLRLSQPIAEDGYGTITVDGVEIPKGTQFLMDVVVKMNCLMVPVGSVAREYGREYTMVLKGFKGTNGKPFPDTTLKFKTMERPKRDHAYDAHDEVAIQAAREGMVLLQNENNVLPLQENEVLNCFGSAQYMFRNTATGAGLINPRWQANFHQSVGEHSSFKINREISDLYAQLRDVVPGEAVLVRAKEQSDTAIILISRHSGEFSDNRAVKGGYYLSDDERAMISAVSKAFPKTVAIINTGYPIEMGWVKEFGIDAVIYTGFAGMGAGYALMEILDGRTNPSGKLPDTWSYDYYDNPAAHNFINLPADHKQVGEKDFGVHIYYGEDIYVGYRYFDTFGKEAAYGFGHGKSYTDFALDFGAPGYENGNVTMDVTVRNTGIRPGKEVVQLYIQAPDGTIEKPRRVLAAFEKTALLKSGESQKLTLVAQEKMFASFCEKTGAFLLEAGEYHIWAGNSLTDSQKIGSFVLAEAKVLAKTNRVNLPVESFKRISKADPTVEEASKIVPLEDRIGKGAPRPVYNPAPLPTYKGKKITFDQLKADPALLDKFVAQMSTDELCKLNVCGGADWYMPWQSGAAGKTAVIRKYKMPKVMVSDGNTGLNLKKRNIGFPSSCTVAASFNKELAYQIGKTIAEESREHGIGMNLGPAMNIHRNILNGRHPEYFSEDPCLGGIMAGFHGKGLEENGCGCTYKHLFCNSSDTSRKASHSIVSERALREIYCKVFEVAVDVHQPSGIMTSYNAVNGIYPAENAEILQTFLREEWGLDSLIMTDWGTYDTVDPVEMVKAGNCWLTEGGGKYVRILQKAVKEGKLSRAVLEHNARYVVKTILKWS